MDRMIITLMVVILKMVMLTMVMLMIKIIMLMMVMLTPEKAICPVVSRPPASSVLLSCSAEKGSVDCPALSAWPRPSSPSSCFGYIFVLSTNDWVFFHFPFLQDDDFQFRANFSRIGWQIVPSLAGLKSQLIFCTWFLEWQLIVVENWFVIFVIH